MPHGVKIATCCYCGTRAALRLVGRERHELACAACGAPLHSMKRLPEDRPGKATRPKRAVTAPPVPARKSGRKRQRKPLWRKALAEAFELVEDMLD